MSSQREARDPRGRKLRNGLTQQGQRRCGTRADLLFQNREFDGSLFAQRRCGFLGLQRGKSDSLSLCLIMVFLPRDGNSIPPLRIEGLLELLQGGAQELIGTLPFARRRKLRGGANRL